MCLAWTILVGKSTVFFLSWTVMIGLSPCFVCRGQYWLVYLPMLYVMNKMVGISPGFVCYGQ